jgi:hypothetical protein
MIFPRGEPRHQNLSTAYTDLSALLKTMKAEGFSGTVEAAFPGRQGIIFVASGEIIDAEARSEGDSKRTSGHPALQEILTLSNRKDGVLHVYRMSPDRVAAATGMLQSELLFKDLSSDFTRLDRLILKMREEKHNGFMEILTKQHKEMGTVFFREGEVTAVFASSESGASLVEKKNISVFLQNAVRQGVLLNVYRNQGKKPVRESAVKETVEKETRVKETVAKEPPSKEFPSKATPAEQVGGKSPVAGESPVKEPPGGESNGGPKDIIPILQDILSRVEKLADIGSRKGVFLREFKRSLIEKAEKYPFLDPFAGEFDYKDGAIGFKGEAGTKELARGIGECLRLTLYHIEDELPKHNKTLPAKLVLEIEALLERHREGTKRLGVDTLLHSIFQ